jgi:hypothetical protein
VIREVIASQILPLMARPLGNHLSDQKKVG